MFDQMKNDIHIAPILQNDIKFKYMLEQAMPDTKYFINKLFLDVKSDIMFKPDFLKAEGNYIKAI